MEVVKRRNQFLVDIRRKNKRDFFDSQRKSYQASKSRPKPTLTPSDRTFINLQRDFIDLEENDMERLITLAQAISEYSKDNLNCPKQITDRVFFDKLFGILVDMPQHINAIEIPDAQGDLSEAFENLSLVVYNLMCEISFRTALGLEAVKHIEQILLQNPGACPVNLGTLVKTLLVASEEVSIWNWLVMKSKFVDSVFKHKWNFRDRVGPNQSNQFILERVQILLIGDLTTNLLDNWKQLGTADDSQIERFLRLLESFLMNLKSYFELIMGDAPASDDSHSANLRVNLNYWRSEMNPRIVKTLRTIFFSMESDSVFELSQLRLMLIHHDINVMLFGLPLIRALEDSASLSYLNDILRITLQEEDSDFAGLSMYFAEIDLTETLVTRFDTFNMNQRLHAVEFVNMILGHFLAHDVEGLDSVREKIPVALVTKVSNFLQIFFESTEFSRVEFELGEQLTTFLGLYARLVPEKAFESFVDMWLEFLCFVCLRAFDLMDPEYLDATLRLIHQILSRLYYADKLTSEMTHCFDRVKESLENYVNQKFFEEIQGFTFDYKESTKNTIYQILVFLDNK